MTIDREKISLDNLAGLLGGELRGDGDHEVNGLGGLDEAGPSELSFLANARYLPQLAETKAGCVLVPPDVETPAGLNVIVVPDPSRALAQIAEALMPMLARVEPGIHPTAVIGEKTRIGDGVSIGAHVVVEDGARIGDGCSLFASAYIGHAAQLGPECWIGPSVVIGERVQIGARVRVHGGTVIGADGFGYWFEDGVHHRIPQVGTVVVEDDVEIGANCAIDRARFDRTVIGAGTKIDNLVHIAHNVRIGRGALLIAQVGVAGSAKIGNYCILAGQAGVNGHVTMGDGARVAGKSGVTRDVPPQTTIAGTHGLPHRDYVKIAAAQRKLPALVREVKALRQRIDQLEHRHAPPSADDQPAG